MSPACQRPPRPGWHSCRVTTETARPEDTRRGLRAEVLIVLGLSLGQSAVYSLVNLIAKITAATPLARQTVVMNQSQSPRPYLDLTYQLLGILFGIMPVLLAVYLLRRDHRDPARELGLRPRQPALDLATGLALAAVVGFPGLLLVYAGRLLGISANLVPSGLPSHQWWSVPVLVLAAGENAVLEEVVVVGYLVTRLKDLGWSGRAAVVASAVLRGSYHLYQGFGAFVGNAAMGLLFGAFFLRTRRVLPLVVAHAILDVCAFVGYQVVPKDWLSWL
jgi:uncharacterized protein